MTSLTWAVAAVFTIYCVVVISAWAFQRSLIYLPDPARVLLESVGLPATEEVWFDRPDGIRLVAWYQPPRHGDQTLLYFHGNAGNLAARAERMRAYAELGYGMLMLSYRGYSGSTGAPSEAHNVMDAVAVFDWLRARVKDHRNIVLYGESLGSGVAVQVALQRRCGGLILDAPFTSIAELGQQAYPILPVKALLTDRYDTLTQIPSVATPVLVLHGALDAVTPVSMGRRIFEAAVAPKRLAVVPGAGHSDHHDHGAFEIVQTWLSDLHDHRD